MNLTFSRVQALMFELHPLTSRKSITSRFRYFQRLGFLEGTNHGPRRASLYDLNQLLQVLVAFELSQAGLPPARIIAMLRGSWPRLQKSMQLGWNVAIQPASLKSRELLVSVPANLSEEPDESSGTYDCDDLLRSVTPNALTEWGSNLDGLPRRLFIDPARMMLGLKKAFEGIVEVPLFELNEAFLVLCLPGLSEFPSPPRAVDATRMQHAALNPSIP